MTETVHQLPGKPIDSKPDDRWVANYFIGTPKRLVLWGACFITIAAVLAAIDVKEHYFAKFLHELVRDIGIAAWVAAIVAIVVDFHAERERNEIFSSFSREAMSAISGLSGKADATIQKLSDDARMIASEVSEKGLESYLKRELPAGWFEYVRDMIRAAPFFRHSLRVAVGMKYPPKDIKAQFPFDDYLVCEQTIRYKVKNVTDREEVYVVPVMVEIPERRELIEILRVLNFDINGKPLSKEQLDAARSAEPDTSTHWTFRHAETIDPGGELDVYLRIRTARSLRNTFVWLNMLPSTGINVDAHPGDGVSAQVTVIHPDCISPIVREAKDGETVSVGTKKPVLPYTAVEFKWGPSAAADVSQ